MPTSNESTSPSDTPSSAKASVEFSPPAGSGLEGVTDVALVMANAMSRLVDERPELRPEFEAMQTRRSAPEEAPAPRAEERPRSPRSTSRAALEVQDSEEDQDDKRRRRRRRRRGRRQDWSSDAVIMQKSSAPTTEALLDRTASVLGEAAGRSLHIRQIAEHLAAQGVLGGEISEIERATTAALVSDAVRHGNASRFVLRGDARYQLRGGRLPEPLAAAEATLRKAARVVERETSEHLVRWLETLGARALEALVRVYFERENITVISSLPASRGITRMIVDDPDGDEGQTSTLVFVLPKRANLDPRMIESEVEKSGCACVMAFAMGEVVDSAWIDDARIIQAREFASWLVSQGIGVSKITYEVSVLDPSVIESIAGLDT